MNLVDTGMQIVLIGMICLISTAILQIFNVPIKIRKIFGLGGFSLVIIGVILLLIHYFINGVQ